MGDPMLKFLISALIAGLALGQAAVAADLTSVTNDLDALLQKHVRASGGVNYQGLAADKAAVDAILSGYDKLNLQGASPNARLAALINLYNIGMMANLLRYAASDNISIASPRFLALKINDISVPGGNIWNGDYKLKLSGTPLTLDEIEHGLIRGQAAAPEALAAIKLPKLDPRIHAAVNCAAVSCPRVRERAYREDSVDAMLSENMRAYVSSEEHFAKVDDDTLKANKIVLWYYSDFDQHGKALGLKGAGDYLASFLAPQTKDKDWKTKHLQGNFNDRSQVSLKISSAFDFFYDWRVNDQRNKP